MGATAESTSEPFKNPITRNEPHPLSLGGLRTLLGKSRQEVAKTLAVSTTKIRNTEENDWLIGTAADYLEALSGRLILRIRYPDGQTIQLRDFRADPVNKRDPIGLRKARFVRGLNSKEAGSRSGCSANTILQTERTRNPHVSSVRRFAIGIGGELEALASLEGRPLIPLTSPPPKNIARKKKRRKKRGARTLHSN